MKTIIFQGVFDSESVSDLIEKIEQPHYDEKETDIRLLLSCAGGEENMAQALIDCINRLPDEYDFELVITFAAISSAFDVFLMTKCKKRLYDGAYAIVHLLTREVSSREVIHDKKGIENKLIDELSRRNAKYLEKLDALGVFTQKELKKISKGKEVFVDGYRLQKIIDNQQKHGSKRK